MTAAAILAILWGFCRGFREGVAMYVTAPRFHPWFAWYHLIEVGEILALAACAVIAGNHFGEVTDMVWIAGLLVLSWEAFEVAYAWARLGQAARHENVLGVFTVDGSAVRWIHVSRIMGGMACLGFSWYC